MLHILKKVCCQEIQSLCTVNLWNPKAFIQKGKECLVANVLRIRTLRTTIAFYLIKSLLLPMVNLFFMMKKLLGLAAFYEGNIYFKQKV